MDTPFTLSFDDFWTWLTAHSNCILRAGTPQATLYDNDDLHWHSVIEENGVCVVQAIKGKQALGELFIEVERVAYVQGLPGEQAEENLFELVSESDGGQPIAFFVLAHGYEEEDPSTKRVQ